MYLGYDAGGRTAYRWFSEFMKAVEDGKRPFQSNREYFFRKIAMLMTEDYDADFLRGVEYTLLAKGYSEHASVISRKILNSI